MSIKKDQKKCIFCNGYGLTKQHVFPDWIKKILPRDSTNHHQNITSYALGNNKTIFVHPDLQIKNGHPGSRKIRNVCGNCNNGWMSELEQIAKPSLTDLILGNNTTLSQGIQAIIARWVVMTSIMAEYTDTNTISIQELHRTLLMSKSNPGEGWQIWLGNYSGNEWVFRYRHHGGFLLKRDQYEKLIKENKKPELNLQISTIVLGALFIHSVCSLPEVSQNFVFDNDLKESVIKIWPPNEELIISPSSNKITDSIANEISEYFFMKHHPLPKV